MVNMVIEKVHGLRATSITLNERFSMLLAAAPDRFRVAKRPKRRPSVGSFLNQTLTNRNRNLVEEIVRQLDYQAPRQQSIHNRLGVPGRLRRFGSESSLPGLRRSNSFGNLARAPSVRSRLSWRQSNGNLSRARSVSLSDGRSSYRGRAPRRRVAANVQQRMFRPGRQGPGRGRGRGRGRGMRRGAATGVPRRGGRTPARVTPSLAELDAQLEAYMAGSAAALDRELDLYMQNAMDLE